MHRQLYTHSTDYIRCQTTNLTRGANVLGWWWFSRTVVSLAEANRSLSFRQLSSLWCSLLTSACSICMEILTKQTKKNVEILLEKQTNRWFTKFPTIKSTLIVTCPCECTDIFRKQPRNTPHTLETIPPKMQPQSIATGYDERWRSDLDFQKSQQVESEQHLDVFKKYLKVHSWVSEWTLGAVSALQPPGYAHLLSVAPVERRTLVQPPWQGREEREELGLREVIDSL